MISARRLPLALGWSLALAACGVQNSPALASPSVNAPTYYADVQPILAQHCNTCHTADGIAPFSLETYAAAQAEAGMMASDTKALIMPPWPPDDTCNSYQNDRSLRAADIDILQQWVAAGAPEGSPQSLSPALSQSPPANPMGRQPDLVVEAAHPYVSPPTAGTDDYHCFVEDPNLASGEDVVGVDVVPGNPRIVHHVILYEVEEANLPALTQLDPMGQGYTCFGDALVPANWVAAWAPGGTGEKFPEGTGVHLHPGSKLVMQVHYNLLNGRGLSDQSQVQLWFSSSPVQYQATIQPIAQTLLEIPPNVSGFQVPYSYTVPESTGSLRVWGVAGHMHLLGTAWKMWVQPTSGPNECLLNLPDWNFHWQSLYFLDQPLTVNPGDIVNMLCVYNNTAANQPIINGVQQVPKEVTWGEDTTDEMCLGLVYLTQ